MFYGIFPMDLGVPLLRLENLLESNPLRSRFSVCGLAVRESGASQLIICLAQYVYVHYYFHD